jgi:hypothetical protein
LISAKQSGCDVQATRCESFAKKQSPKIFPASPEHPAKIAEYTRSINRAASARHDSFAASLQSARTDTGMTFAPMVSRYTCFN